MDDTDSLIRNFQQNDPHQLRKVVEMLMNKTRLLLANLEETWTKLEQTQTEKQFWKDSYFNLRNSCSQYVDSGALVPFNYIASLEEELKKDRVIKSCLEEKFKVMRPQTRSYHKKTPEKQVQPRFGSESVSVRDQRDKSLSSTLVKESPERVKYQNKHKIGPKSIELFKFKEQKQT